MLVTYEARKRNPLAIGDKGKGRLYLVVSFHLTREREREREKGKEKDRDHISRIHDKTRLANADVCGWKNKTTLLPSKSI
jgi:hypothetical protein